MDNQFKDIKLEWHGEILAEVGYGLQARRVLKPLIEGGALVKLLPDEEYIPQERRIQDPFWLAQIERSKQLPDMPIRVSYTIPPLHKFNPKAKNISYAMWETNKYPHTWVPLINRANMFFAGSKALVDSAKNAGVIVPIVPMSPALDGTEWNPHGDKVELSGIAPTDTVFLYIASWLARKNILGLLTCFCAEFKGQKDVALVIKTWGGNNTVEHRNHIQGAIQNHLNSLSNIERPKISIIFDMMPESQVIKLMRRAEIYTCPSHGEGFNLPLMQAMALESLVVANDFLSHGDYLNSANSILYNYTLGPVEGTGMPDYSADQLWSFPDKLSYMTALRSAYQEIKDGKHSKQKNARETILKKYNPTIVAQQLATALREVK